MKEIKWPSEKIRERGGQSGWGTFNPKVADIFIDKMSVNNTIYLVKIKDYYVPVGCSYITSTDQPDSHEQSEQDYLNDPNEETNQVA